MLMFKRFVSTALVGSALLSASLAHAVTWNWSYGGQGVTASGTFTTAGSAASAENVLSITGTRNGTTIVGMVPLDSDENYIYDNLFVRSAPYLTEGGLLFDIGGGGFDAHINLYYDASTATFHDLQILPDGSDITDSVVSFSVTAVPEAATVATMLMGLAFMGVVLRQRRKA